MLSTLLKIKKIYTDVVVWFTALVCLVILGINVLNVVLRYMTSVSFIYTEDVTVMGMLWIMGLGISVGWWNREHLLINIIDSFISPKALEILLFVLDFVGIGTGILMFELAKMTAEINKGLKTSLIGFGEELRYHPIIVGGVLLAIVSLLSIIEQILKWKQGGAKA